MPGSRRTKPPWERGGGPRRRGARVTCAHHMGGAMSRTGSRRKTAGPAPSALFQSAARGSRVCPNALPGNAGDAWGRAGAEDHSCVERL